MKLHYGRFLNLYFPIACCALLRFVVEDGQGGSGDEANADAFFDNGETSPANGKASDAPDNGQDVSGKPGEGENKSNPESPKKGQAQDVSDDALEKALEFGESPEAKAKRLERDYSASSNEAKRLNGEQKAIKAALEAQGLKLSIKDGKVDLVPTDKYSDKPAMLSMKVTEMSATDQEALESGDLSEVQKVLDKVVENARNTLVRALPTREKEAPELSDERLTAVFDQMKSEQDDLGEPKFEGFEKNAGLIKKQLQNPALPAEVKDAFRAHPELMAELFNARTQLRRNALLRSAEKAAAANKKKIDEGRSRSDQNFNNSGTTVISDSEHEGVKAQFGV